MIDDRDRNKDSDCADFFRAFNVMIVPGLFFINPVLALIILTLLTVGAVGELIGSRPGRPHRPYQAPHTLDESYLAVGREPPAPRRSRARASSRSSGDLSYGSSSRSAAPPSPFPSLPPIRGRSSSSCRCLSSGWS